MRFTRGLAALALTGALLAGCGGGPDSGGTTGDAPSSSASSAPAGNGVAALEPDAIKAKAIAALGTAKSFSVKGQGNADGDKMALDVKVSGDDVLGTLTLDGAQFEMLRVGGQMYIRPDETFWQQIAGDDTGAAMGQLMGDRWAKLTGKNTDFQEFFNFIEPAELLKSEGALTKGGTRTIDGVSAIGVVESGPDGGTLYVATTGEPYPLLLEAPPGEEGQLTFGDFGATFVDIKAPAVADVIDMDKLMGS